MPQIIQILFLLVNPLSFVSDEPLTMVVVDLGGEWTTVSFASVVLKDGC